MVESNRIIRDEAGKIFSQGPKAGGATKISPANSMANVFFQFLKNSLSQPALNDLIFRAH